MFGSAGLDGLAHLHDSKSRSISAENPKGEKGRGGMATKGAGANSARELGAPWKISPAFYIEPGQTLEVAEIEGSGAVQSMWFGGFLDRGLIIRFYWDRQETPSVECPITDFFAYGWGRTDEDDPCKGPHHQLTSLPVCVNPNMGLNCFWYMPFLKHCRITVENRSTTTRMFFYQVNYTLEELPEDTAYFHAQFRRVNPLPYKTNYTILDGVRGRGQYVGTAMCYGLNGANYWWGEGEIKFFMDGDDAYPTICGTGTEDYFGGSFNWEVGGKYVTYTTPFMGMYQILQPDGLYQSQQRFGMYRWHIADPIRFDEDIRVTIQDLGWKKPGDRYLARQDDIASTAYWYQTLPTEAFPPLPGNDEVEII